MGNDAEDGTLKYFNYLELCFGNFKKSENLKEYKSQRYVGIELDEPLGKHNGTVIDATTGKEYIYFKCPDGHGALVRYDDVVIDDYHPDHIAKPLQQSTYSYQEESLPCEDTICCKWLDLISGGEASCSEVLQTILFHTAKFFQLHLPSFSV